MTGRGIQFDTKRDWRAFCALLKRSDLGLKEPDVVTLEPIVNADDDIECDHSWQDDDYDWHDCDNLADVRVVRNRAVEYDGLEPTNTPKDVYSDAFCIRCLQRALDEWLQTHLELIATEVFEARERGEFGDEREVQAD